MRLLLRALFAGPCQQDLQDDLPPAPDQGRQRLQEFKDTMLAKLKALQETHKVLDIVLQVLEDPLMKHYALQLLGLNKLFHDEVVDV